MTILLLSTYELGRQPFGLASPAAWLREAGFDVSCVDLARSSLPESAVPSADLIGLYLPMHTAARLAVPVIERVRTVAPSAHLCCYGLYAPLNAPYLRALGVDTILGGEFEDELVGLARRLNEPGADPAGRAGSGEARGDSVGPGERVPRLAFRVPDRRDLAPLARYASVNLPDGRRRVAGYTETSRGCKHRCRHCPIVPVYDGQFRIVPREVVLADIRAQVEAGAEHITFGDPDFFNGVGHATALVRAIAREFPALSYDVTIKVEHLVRHAAHLPLLADTGCLFVTSAVESVDDRVLDLLDKGHTRADFLEAVRLCRAAGLGFAPTFVAFTPWLTIDGYVDLLETIDDLDLVDAVAPIQLAIRLLIPAGSRLVDLAAVRGLIKPFDPARLIYPWSHPDPAVDDLHAGVGGIVGRRLNAPRRDVFEAIRRLARTRAGLDPAPIGRPGPLRARASIPYLDEPWYC